MYTVEALEMLGDERLGALGGMGLEVLEITGVKSGEVIYLPVANFGPLAHGMQQHRQVEPKDAVGTPRAGSLSLSS